MINNLRQFIILFFITSFLISCGDSETKNKKIKKEIYITTSKAILTTFEDKETAIGSIKGIIDPTIAAEISGAVVKLFVRTGSVLKKGELLAEIENKRLKKRIDELDNEIESDIVNVHKKPPHY